MTREEAIITLKVVDENATCDDCLYYNSMEDCPNDEDCIIRQAFNMAIKALDQEPTTKNEAKYCDRNICLKNEYNNVGCEDCEVTTKNNLGVDCISRADALDCVNWGYSFSDIYKKINELPSVTPQEPKTGHWIDCDNSDDYSADGYDCSVCGVNAEYATSYCPNCGARMVEPQESEDKE